jgi:hypothetical protein
MLVPFVDSLKLAALVERLEALEKADLMETSTLIVGGMIMKVENMLNAREIRYPLVKT